ncbi:solute carrier family 35 member G1-like [Diadema antillarum]|uniref:solute carrier family 35 member G1-like n=1 Tax=Diadema antillarum TaxID=105358 RepID=UPI003A86F93F
MANYLSESSLQTGADPDDTVSPFLHASDNGHTQRQRAKTVRTEGSATISSLPEQEDDVNPKGRAVTVDIFCRRRGLIYTLASVLLLCSLTLTIKFLSDNVSANLLNFYYGIFLMMCSGPVLVWKKVSLFKLSKEVWIFLLLRSLAGAACMTCFSYSLLLLDISTAKSLQNLMPLFATTFARICLKESCTIAKTTFSCLGVLGIFLVVQPSAIFGYSSREGEKLASTFAPGVVTAIGTAVFYATSVVLLRKLGQIKVSAQLALFCNGLMMSLVSAIITTILGEWRNISCVGDRFYLVATGYLGFFELACLTLALQTENAALVSVLRTSDVLLTFILDVIIFHTKLNLLTVAGALFIVTSSVGITVAPLCRKYTKRKNSCT